MFRSCSLREKRPDRPIDHAAVQNFAFGRFAFAFEKSARDFSGRIEIFTVVDSKREEIKSFPGFFCGACGDQHYGIAVADNSGAMGLFCQLADLDREFSLSDHRADFMNIHLI